MVGARQRMGGILFGLALVLCFAPASAEPNFPALTDRVVDDANLLDPTDEQAPRSRKLLKGARAHQSSKPRCARKWAPRNHRSCDKLLAKHFPPGRYDANELPNHLIVLCPLRRRCVDNWRSPRTATGSYSGSRRRPWTRDLCLTPLRF